MSLLSIDIQCNECAWSWNDLVERGTESGAFACPHCQGFGKRVPSPPNRTKHSYVDGHRREGFQKLREQDKIDRALSEAQPGSSDKLALVEERQKLSTKKS